MAEKTEYDMIQEATSFIRERWNKKADVGVVLGTGLGGLADRITADSVISYDEIPYFAPSTVESHVGKLILGTLEGKNVVAMQGRLHYYEGYSPEEVVLPARLDRRTISHPDGRHQEDVCPASASGMTIHFNPLP